MVDSLGNPLRFILTGGQRNDITQAENLISDIEKRIVFVDKDYDANRLVERLKTKGCEVVIPSKKNRKMLRSYDQHIYKERHLIECFLEKLNIFVGYSQDLISQQTYS